ncbi:ATP-dependent 6-phosphofructokinase [uncultured Jatrophihabitans sp.]|uniref:ATP-dependent 6-phosphofructokinase n=1 Tax=uncultured Jatrophihabitans sp. TaxID=1610747 RepID=UPI0035CBFE9C
MFTRDVLALSQADLVVRELGKRRYVSPLAHELDGRRDTVHWVGESDRVLLDDTRAMAVNRGIDVGQLPAFEPAGPRKTLYFDPSTTRVGIVTCGGLCPGLNNVVRGLVLELNDRYGIHDVVGFQGGYRGLTVDGAKTTTVLTRSVVHDIQNRGGTVLGTSRGAQDPDEMVDTLVERGITVLFVIGGDGSLRGAQRIAEAATARGYDLAVVGVPKTIDNDIPFIDRSFGFETAFTRAAESIRAASTEARSTPNGVGLVKLMGRHSGFIACYATLAQHDVDFVVIPEVPFRFEGHGGLLDALRRRVDANGHAVVVVAESAGQDLLQTAGTDASGNARLADIGTLTRDRVVNHFARENVELSLRYVDPGYAIRSVAANGYDAEYCLRLAQAAVHAALAGRTAMVVGMWHGRFVHIPIPLATSGRNQVDPDGDLWMAVLEATGQPARFS